MDFEDIVDGAVGVAEFLVEIFEFALCLVFGDGFDECHVDWSRGGIPIVC